MIIITELQITIGVEASIGSRLAILTPQTIQGNTVCVQVDQHINGLTVCSNQ